MAEKDLPSNSDESDEDFVPEAANPSSEDDSVSGHSDEDSNDGKGTKPRKRRKLTKKRKKKKEDEESSEEKEEKPQKVTDVDALWADFKQDVGKMEKQIVSNNGEKVSEKANTETKNEKPVESNSDPAKTPSEDKKRSFPGRINSGSKLGLNKILNQIGKKDKMSTLAKSQLDWNNFKKNEGIDEEIKMHNKGRDGYLEKQDFLQRTDLRQFEIEKQLRATRRKF